jgi:hypothetical protein
MVPPRSWAILARIVRQWLDSIQFFMNLSARSTGPQMLQACVGMEMAMRMARDAMYFFTVLGF